MRLYFVMVSLNFLCKPMQKSLRNYIMIFLRQCNDANCCASKLLWNRSKKIFKHAWCKLAAHTERRRLYACKYEMDNHISYFTIACSSASQIISIPRSSRVPAAKRQRTSSGRETEDPKIAYESVSIYWCNSNVETVHLIKQFENNAK